MALGTVKWFNPEKGFDFIEQDGGGPDVLAASAAIERLRPWQDAYGRCADRPLG
jgi:cold shock CspA family protein